MRSDQTGLTDKRRLYSRGCKGNVRLESLTYVAVCRLSLRESVRTFAERRATFVRLESLTYVFTSAPSAEFGSSTSSTSIQSSATVVTKPGKT